MADNLIESVEAAHREYGTDIVKRVWQSLWL